MTSPLPLELRGNVNRPPCIAWDVEVWKRKLIPGRNDGCLRRGYFAVRGAQEKREHRGKSNQANKDYYNKDKWLVFLFILCIF